MNCRIGGIPEFFRSRQGHSNRAELQEAAFDEEYTWQRGRLAKNKQAHGLTWALLRVWVFLRDAR